MSADDDYTLKIADTPEDDDSPLPDDATADATCSPDPIPPLPPAPTKSKRRGQRGSVQRLTPEEMDEKIERMQLENGRPTLARGTDRD